METKQIYYPQVTKIPGQGSDTQAPKKPGEADLKKGEFDQSLDQAIGKAGIADPSQATGVASVKMPLVGAPTGLKFSAHAAQRLRDRSIQFDQATLARMNDAITKAESKGVQDTLVLTDKAALIVSVPNRTVITAMDRAQLDGNVFTNIDGAVII